MVLLQLQLFFLHCLILCLQIEELTISLPALQALSSSNSSLDSSTSSTDTTSSPVKRNPLSPRQGGARKALLRWVQHTATKYVVDDLKNALLKMYDSITSRDICSENIFIFLLQHDFPSFPFADVWELR